MQSWQLPEHIADILPSTARQLESAKEREAKLQAKNKKPALSKPD